MHPNELTFAQQLSIRRRTETLFHAIMHSIQRTSMNQIRHKHSIADAISPNLHIGLQESLCITRPGAHLTPSYRITPIGPTWTPSEFFRTRVWMAARAVLVPPKDTWHALGLTPKRKPALLSAASCNSSTTSRPEEVDAGDKCERSNTYWTWYLRVIVRVKMSQ